MARRAERDGGIEVVMRQAGGADSAGGADRATCGAGLAFRVGRVLIAQIRALGEAGALPLEKGSSAGGAGVLIDADVTVTLTELACPGRNVVEIGGGAGHMAGGQQQEGSAIAGDAVGIQCLGAGATARMAVGAELIHIVIIEAVAADAPARRKFAVVGSVTGEALVNIGVGALQATEVAGLTGQSDARTPKPFQAVAELADNT